MTYKFCVAAYLDDIDKFEKFASSIVDSGDTVKSKLVVFILSPESEQSVIDHINQCNIAEKRELFRFIVCRDASDWGAYNFAFNEADSEYISFTTVSSYYSSGAFEKINTFAESKSENIISLIPEKIDDDGGLSALGIADSFMSASKEAYRKVNLRSLPHMTQLFLGSHFIKRRLILKKKKKTPFKDSGIYPDADKEFLLSIFKACPKYTLIADAYVIFSRPQEDDFNNFPLSYEKSWYSGSITGWMIPFAGKSSKKKAQPEFIQYSLLYLLFARYNCNYMDRNKFVLDNNEVFDFFRQSEALLSYIDYDIIFEGTKKMGMPIPRALRVHFLRLKAAHMNKIPEPCFDGDTAYYMFRDRDENESFKLKNVYTYKISRGENGVAELVPLKRNINLLKIKKIANEKVHIRIINYIDGKLKIDGQCSLGELFTDEYFKLYAKYNGKSIQLPRSESFSSVKVFDKQYTKVYRFHLSLPFDAESDSALKFYCVINGKRHTLRIASNSSFAHLSSKIKSSYWNFAPGCVAKLRSGIIEFEKADVDRLDALERAFSDELKCFASEGDAAAEEALSIREEYFRRRAEFAGRRIWITFDKLYKAGDNGEYMYRYISSIDAPVEIYYVVNERSADYERLKNEKNILAFGSREHKLISLFAEAALTTHTGLFRFSGFKNEHIPYLSNIFNPVNIHIQHGLTVQNMPHKQGRIIDNFSVYICTSPLERANVLSPEYGFINKESVSLTGMARYDGLRSDPKKIILITPTWRKFLASGANMGNARKHNDNFKHSAYFTIYNSLINDERLINCARENGYRIIFLVHPVSSSQAVDYDKNDYVEIMPATGGVNYEKILTEADLMVTDYSGVQFDFAYQKKPLIYYHPKDLPPNYEESTAFRCERDGFGPIFDNHEDIINGLCAYMNSGCRLAEKYRARIDRFFAFNDFNNCERVYRLALNYMEKLGNDGNEDRNYTS